jgi:hypothetical protein
MKSKINATAWDMTRDPVRTLPLLEGIELRVIEGGWKDVGFDPPISLGCPVRPYPVPPHPGPIIPPYAAYPPSHA